MHRIRTVAAGALMAVALGACQTAATASPTQTSAAAGSPATAPSAMTSPDASGGASAAPSGQLNQLFPVFEATAGGDLTGGGIITDVEDGASAVIGVVAPGAAEEGMPLAIVEGDCATQSDQGPPAPAVPEPSAEPSAGASADASAAASPDESAAASPDASGAASPSAEASPSGIPEGFPMWLTTIMAGSSNTLIPVGVDELTAAPHALIIETSPTDPTIVACADLKTGPPTSSGGTGGEASPGASGGASPAGSPEASDDVAASPSSS
jgi:hypothetical protein